MNLSKDIKVTVVEAAGAAAQTELVTDVLDMSGYEGVIFMALLGDVTTASVLTLTAQNLELRFNNTAKTLSSWDK